MAIGLGDWAQQEAERLRAIMMPLGMATNGTIKVPMTTKPKAKSFRQELRAEIDEWLSGVLV